MSHLLSGFAEAAILPPNPLAVSWRRATASFAEAAERPTIEILAPPEV
jgi:hypothetical protein